MNNALQSLPVQWQTDIIVIQFQCEYYFLSGIPFLINDSYPNIPLSFTNLKRNAGLIYFLWKRTFHLAIRSFRWDAGGDATAHKKLGECGWEVGIMMMDPDIKSPRCHKCGNSIEVFICNELRKFTSVSTHIAASVSITMVTHGYAVQAPEVICKCPVSSPLPPLILSIHSFLWHHYSLEYTPSVSPRL